MTNIPGINYNTRQSLNRLKLQADIYNEEFVQRMQLTIGHPDYFTSPSYGIVAPLDPASAVPGSTGTPLVVSINATDDQTVDIAPGMGVTRSGMWIHLTDYARQIALADPSVGVSNVVYLRYILDQDEPILNDYYEEVIPATLRPGSVGSVNGTTIQISVDTLDVYLGYNQSTLDDFVPLAIVTAQSSQDPITLLITTGLSIDHTRGNYGWNRPWFSVRDVEHRNQVGTGTVTSTNIHGVSPNDLTIGDFSPMQLQLDHGMVVADDRSIAKVPGVRCQVSIPYDSILEDDEFGTYTSIPYAQYVELPNFPIRLGRVWIESTNVDWAAEIIAETNRVVLPYSVPINESIGMFYTKVVACEPPTAINEVTFSTNSPDEQELIIAGGSGFTVLSNTQEPMADAQRFPMVYDVLVDGEGSIIKTPQVIYCYKRLESITTSDDFTISLYGPGRVICGLTGASGAGTMSVKIRLYGKDVNGNSIEHLFEFDSTWAEPGPIPKETITTAGYKVSDQIFYAVDQIVVEERLFDGPNSAIMLWSAQNPVDTYDKLKDACHVSRVFWNGIGMSTVKDKRVVSTTTRDYLLGNIANQSLMYLANILAGSSKTLYLEDFFCPRYSDQVLNTDKGGLVNTLPVNNMYKLRPGMDGLYETRALPVATSSGSVWRVVLLPLKQTKAQFSYFPQPTVLPTATSARPTFYFHDGASWQALVMSPVAGLYNTFETTVVGIPTMIRVSLVASDYLGMLIFG